MKIPRPLRVLLLGRDPDSSKNYFDKVVAISQSASPGEVLHIEVRHEARCPMLHGHGYCGGDPLVRRMEQGEVV